MRRLIFSMEFWIVVCGQTVSSYRDHYTTFAIKGITKKLLEISYTRLRSEALTAVKMPIVIWFVTPCGLEGIYQRLGGT